MVLSIVGKSMLQAEADTLPQSIRALSIEQADIIRILHNFLQSPEINNKNDEFLVIVTTRVTTMMKFMLKMVLSSQWGQMMVMVFIFSAKADVIELKVMSCCFFFVKNFLLDVYFK